MSGALSSFFTKALSPAYYKNAAFNLLTKSHDYYHPMMREGR